MLVKCTECNITYRLDDSLIKNTGSKVRCSQCKYIFTTFPDKKLLSTPPISSKPVNPLPPETVAISDESIEDSESNFCKQKIILLKRKEKNLIFIEIVMILHQTQVQKLIKHHLFIKLKKLFLMNLNPWKTNKKLSLKKMQLKIKLMMNSRMYLKMIRWMNS